MTRKRKLSSTSIDAMAGSRDAPFEQDGEPTTSRFTNTIKGLFETFAGSSPDPTNPVINGASVQSRPFLARVLADIASQAPRLGENIGLIHSLVDTKLFDGGLVDDRQYQVCKVLVVTCMMIDQEAPDGENPSVGCIAAP